MFDDARTLPDGAALEADLCIIGAGAAGVTIARELAGGPLRVLVLESGGRKPHGDTQRLCEGEVTGIPYVPLSVSRLRAFGGTTHHWGAVCRPFESWDFERADHIPHSGWPIGRSDLDGFYERAGDVCQLRGFDQLTQSERPRDFPNALTSVVEPHLVERIPGARRRFAKNYGREIERAENVVVLLHANVQELEADEHGRTVVAVRGTTLEHNRFRVSARAFVLAAGGIENARLLLLSRSRRPAGLGNGHGLVGRFFLEHPRFVGGVVVPMDDTLSPRAFEWKRIRGATIQTYLRLTPEVRRREGIGEALLRIEPVYVTSLTRLRTAPAVGSVRTLAKSAARGRLPANPIRHLRNVARDLTTWQRAVLPGAPVPIPRPSVVQMALRSERAAFAAHLPELTGDVATFAYWKAGGALPIDHLAVTVILVPAPNPDSRVTLAEKLDPLGQPQARLDWRLGALDRHTARRTLESFASELGRQGAGRLKILLDAGGDDWPDDLHGGYHHMGTTRMSDSPRTGVVDGTCRVHGIGNLFVTGSSTFTTAGSGTPTLALVALALRVTDELKRVLQ